MGIYQEDPRSQKRDLGHPSFFPIRFLDLDRMFPTRFLDLGLLVPFTSSLS
jgi:hypothetical protein